MITLIAALSTYSFTCTVSYNVSIDARQTNLCRDTWFTFRRTWDACVIWQVRSWVAFSETLVNGWRVAWPAVTSTLLARTISHQSVTWWTFCTCSCKIAFETVLSCTFNTLSIFEVISIFAFYTNWGIQLAILAISKITFNTWSFLKIISIVTRQTLCNIAWIACSTCSLARETLTIYICISRLAFCANSLIIAV